MPTIPYIVSENQQLARYSISRADVATDQPAPYGTWKGNVVTPLIDGNNYFSNLENEMDLLTTSTAAGRYFYMANWWLALVDVALHHSVTIGTGKSASPVDVGGMTAFVLPSGTTMINKLAALKAAGVDVRVFGWMNPVLLKWGVVASKPEVTGIVNVNYSTVKSIQALRAKPGLDKSACLNTLAHPLGAMHLKMVVCGDSASSVAYVSGFDPVPNRLDAMGHAAGNGWHDIGIKLRGPAVGDVYDTFAALWNEQLLRSRETFSVDGADVASFVASTPTVAARAWTSDSQFVDDATVDVQVLRTLPQMNFATGSTDEIPIPWIARAIVGSDFKRPAISFAPKGVFEFAAALKRAIDSAERYIYIEDQALYGFPIMDWLNARIKQHAGLKIILMSSGDPADPPQTRGLTGPAINDHLLAGLVAHANIVYFSRTDGTCTHSKITLVDDMLAIVGSANCMRRSLYTDGELSLAICDANQTEQNAVVRLRARLWGEHAGKLNAEDWEPLTELNHAIRMWDAGWTYADLPAPRAARVGLSAVFAQQPIPIVGAAAYTATQYNQIDADSRLTY